MKAVTYEINTLLVKDNTVGEVIEVGNKVLKANGAQNAGLDKDYALAALFVRKDLSRYSFTTKGYGIKVGDFYRMRTVVAEDFIQIHRLNFVAFNVAQAVADRLYEKGLLTKSIKKYWKIAETTYNGYLSAHRSRIDRSTWSTVQDHCRMVYAFVKPYIESLSNSIRDYLIQHRQEICACGQKDDITMITDIYVVLMFVAALRNTRRNFLSDIYSQKGVDFSNDFSYADIDGVGRNFVWMMRQLGFKFINDKDGDSVPAGVDVSQSVRVESAWNRIVDIVTDEDIMDKTALDAINMNPEVKADYEARVAKCEEMEMDAAIGELGTKFKVNRRL